MHIKFKENIKFDKNFNFKQKNKTRLVQGKFQSLAKDLMDKVSK